MKINAHGQLRCRLSRFPLSLLTLAVMLSGCAIDPSPTPLPEPIRPPQQQEAYDANLQQGSVRDEQTLKAQRFQTTPGQVRSGPTYVEASADALGQDLTGPAISLNLNNFPLPAFINEVFGNRLGLSFSIAPALQSKSDLVSLRLNEPQPPADIFATARFVLNDYGVAITEREGVLYFQAADNTANDSLPLLVSGSALPDVPMSHRPVFQQIPMRVVRSDSMMVWLRDMFTGSSLQVSSDILTNSVLLRGPIDLIRQASQAIELFDQPALKGSHSMAISPIYSDAEALGNALINVLKAEGYDVSDTPPSGGLTVLKLKELQRLIVFAADPAILTTARHWVELLDRQSQEQVESGLFVYQVRNTQAASIATMLGALGYSASIPDTGLNNSNTSSPTGTSIGNLAGGSGFGRSSSGTNSGNNGSRSSGAQTIAGNPEQGNARAHTARSAALFSGLSAVLLGRDRHHNSHRIESRPNFPARLHSPLDDSSGVQVLPAAPAAGLGRPVAATPIWPRHADHKWIVAFAHAAGALALLADARKLGGNPLVSACIPVRHPRRAAAAEPAPTASLTRGDALRTCHTTGPAARSARHPPMAVRHPAVG